MNNSNVIKNLNKNLVSRKSAVLLMVFILLAVLASFILLYIYYLKRPVQLFNYINRIGLVKTVPSNWIKFDTPFFINLSDDKPNFYIKYETEQAGGKYLISKMAVVGNPAFATPITEEKLVGEGNQTFILNVIMDDVEQQVLIDRDSVNSYWFSQDFDEKKMGKYNFFRLESVNVENKNDGEVYDNRGKKGLMSIGYGYQYLLPGDQVNLVWEMPSNSGFGLMGHSIDKLFDLSVTEMTTYRGSN